VSWVGSRFIGVPLAQRFYVCRSSITAIARRQHSAGPQRAVGVLKAYGGPASRRQGGVFKARWVA